MDPVYLTQSAAHFTPIQVFALIITGTLFLIAMVSFAVMGIVGLCRRGKSEIPMSILTGPRPTPKPRQAPPRFVQKYRS